MHKYTDLQVYREALGFTVKVRQTAKNFPRDERATLGAQFTRAADSVVLNIAEGAGCDSNVEFARFLTFAIRSGFECKACCDIAIANGIGSDSEVRSLHQNADRVIAMLYGLQKHLRHR
jgi:four helix bundle protein